MSQKIKFFFFPFFLITFFACNPKSDPKSDPQLPLNLTTSEVTSITSSTAITGGIITSIGSSKILSRGVCWSTKANPTITDTKTNDSITSSTTFISSISGLSASTTYYIRAYATNSEGTSYGNEVQFTTLSPSLPVLTTSDISIINQTIASGGGNITSNGGVNITSRGICWSLKSNPTIADNKSSDGSGSGTFTSSMTGFIYGKIYYVRAYATNSLGTAYGDRIKFYTSTDIVTDIDGNKYNTVVIGNQTWMVENLKTSKYNDGTAITNTSDNTAWTGLTTGAYCWYYNNSSYKDDYGGLYNWYAVNSGKLAPKGFHVPTYDEWVTLINYVQNNYGYSGSTGKALAGSGSWVKPSTFGGSTSNLLIGNDFTNNNYSCFTANPSACRTTGSFGSLGLSANFWSSTSYSSSSSYAVWLVYNESICNKGISNITDGLSVRCIKD